MEKRVNNCGICKANFFCHERVGNIKTNTALKKAVFVFIKIIWMIIRRS